MRAFREYSHFSCWDIMWAGYNAGYNLGYNEQASTIVTFA